MALAVTSLFIWNTPDSTLVYSIIRASRLQRKVEGFESFLAMKDDCCGISLYENGV